MKVTVFYKDESFKIIELPPEFIGNVREYAIRKFLSSFKKEDININVPIIEEDFTVIDFDTGKTISNKFEIVKKLKQLPNIRPTDAIRGDIKKLINICHDYLKTLQDSDGEVEMDDDMQHIFEAAMKLVYGDDIFDYINRIHK